jgi:hypothetical protein
MSHRESKRYSIMLGVQGASAPAARRVGVLLQE